MTKLLKNKFENFLLNSCFDDISKEKPLDSNKLLEINKVLVEQKNFPLLSIVQSYLALEDYKKEKDYLRAALKLNNAKYLAENPIAQKINLFCSSLVEYFENNTSSALDLISASLRIKIEEYDFDKAILELREKIELQKQSLKPEKDDALLAFLKVGRTIAVEENLDTLLTIIAQQIQHALSADRCTVFILDTETKELWSKVALGLETQEIRFSVEKGLAGHVALSGETINIKDAYKSKYFNKEIDLKTGYKTKNILCMPIRNMSHQITGVIQVLNKQKGSFNKRDEELLLAIGSSAGIALENANLFQKQKKLIEEQKMLFSSFIDTLAASIDARDKITSGHSKRVTMYAELICDNIKLSNSKKEIVKNASMLHDIGKIGIKDSVLQKEGKLTKEEYEHIKEHVKLTYNILKNVYISKDFKEVTEIASSHHEKYDGTGYFKGLKGDEIPLGGRILAICDVFDAITSKRHYRNKMEIIEALKIIVEGSNKHFDRKLVDAFMNIRCFDILKIMNDNSIEISKKDASLLKKFKLIDLYGILINKESSDIEPIDTFNRYYY